MTSIKTVINRLCIELCTIFASRDHRVLEPCYWWCIRVRSKLVITPNSKDEFLGFSLNSD